MLVISVCDTHIFYRIRPFFRAVFRIFFPWLVLLRALFWLIYSQSRRSYYLFFNYLFFNYLDVLPVWYTNRGGVLPVWYKTTPFRVTRLVLDNSLESPAPVDKPYGGNRLERPRSGFQPVGALENLSLRHRAVRSYHWGRNGP